MPFLPRAFSGLALPQVAWPWSFLAAILCAVIVAPSAACGQQVAVEEFTLPNGMQFLLVPRNDQPNVVSAGWVAN